MANNTTLRNATNIGTLIGAGASSGELGKSAPSNFFKFKLSSRSSFSTTLSQLKANADLTLLNGRGKPILLSSHPGKSQETILPMALKPGTYYIRVNAVGKANTRYTLTYDAAPASFFPMF
jgi:hypothetical protein